MIKKLICVLLPFLKMCGNSFKEEEKIKIFSLDEKNLSVRANEIRLFDLINDFRKENNVTELEFNGDLYRLCRLRNLRHIDNGGIEHSHLYTDVKEIFDTTDIAIEENLAEGFSYPKSALNGWIKSDKGHKETLLSGKYAGIAIDDKYYTLIVK